MQRNQGVAGLYIEKINYVYPWGTENNREKNRIGIKKILHDLLKKWKESLT